ncbi:MAG TPA: hypothetical protein VHT28_15270 [Silvibacterium sp.]|nr:hypothetical protein [Silvibacterium sp.]
MSIRTVSFRTASEKLEQLDSLAASQQRDRTFIINEALDQYLSLQNYHRSLIEEGIRQADAGQLTAHEKVVARSKSWNARR